MKRILPKGGVAVKCFDETKSFQSILTPPGSMILVIPANVSRPNATLLSSIKVPPTASVIALPPSATNSQEKRSTAQNEDKLDKREKLLSASGSFHHLEKPFMKKQSKKVKLNLDQNTKNTKQNYIKKLPPRKTTEKQKCDLEKSSLVPISLKPNGYEIKNNEITSKEKSSYPYIEVKSPQRVIASTKTKFVQRENSYNCLYSNSNHENFLGKFSNSDEVSNPRVGSPPSYESHIEGSSVKAVASSDIGSDISMPQTYIQSPQPNDLSSYVSPGSNVYSIPSNRVETTSNLPLYQNEQDGPVHYNAENYQESTFSNGDSSINVNPMNYYYEPSNTGRDYDLDSRYPNIYLNYNANSSKDYCPTGSNFDSSNIYINDYNDYNDNEPRDYSNNSASHSAQRRQADDCMKLIESLVESANRKNTSTNMVNESSYEERRKLAVNILNTTDNASKRKKALKENFWIVEDEPLNESTFLRNKEPSDQDALKVFKAIKLKTKPPREFICHICGKMLRGSNSLRSHIHLHQNIKPYECQYCSRKFTQSSILNNHIRTHTGETPYSCGTCGKSFKTLAILRKHLTKHSKLRPFKCCVCSKAFKSKVDLQSHLKIHLAGPHLCSICKTLFDTRRALGTHIQRKHKTQKKYVCTICNKVYGLRCLLKQHLNVHSNELKHSCYVCGAAYVWKSGLVAHLRTHSFRIQCEICGVKFISLKKLEKHRSRHSEPLPHKCSKCERQFKFSYLLKKHLGKHKDELSCTECGIGFMTKTKLKKHLKIHAQCPN